MLYCIQYQRIFNNELQFASYVLLNNDAWQSRLRLESHTCLYCHTCTYGVGCNCLYLYQSSFCWTLNYPCTNIIFVHWFDNICFASAIQHTCRETTIFPTWLKPIFLFEVGLSKHNYLFLYTTLITFDFIYLQIESHVWFIIR